MSKPGVPTTIHLEVDVAEALRRHVFDNRTTKRAVVDEALRKALKLKPATS